MKGKSMNYDELYNKAQEEVIASLAIHKITKTKVAQETGICRQSVYKQFRERAMTLKTYLVAKELVRQKEAE